MTEDHLRIDERSESGGRGPTGSAGGEGAGPLSIDRRELFDPEIDKALARERAGRVRIVADPPPVSPIRRVLLNSLFYLPLAAVLAALLSWSLLEPEIVDWPVVRGEIILVNADPFDGREGVLSVTIGAHEVLIDTARVKLEAGDSEPAYASAESLKVGDRIEAIGLAEGNRLFAGVIRPSWGPDTQGSLEKPSWPLFLLFPLTAALIAFALLFSEGITTRNWIRMTERSLLGSFLAALFATLAFVPAGLCLRIAIAAMESELATHPDDLVTMKSVSASTFLIYTSCRSAAWACVGAATGLGMNLVRATRTQLRNSVIGGALGGALGGLFFDPIDRYLGAAYADGATPRMIGLIAVGVSIGVFVALVERLAREAWLRVRTGPLAGKSFVLYKTPTIIGNAPQSDIYLYKDAEIDPCHASLHRVGASYEIEDMGTRMGTSVAGSKIRRRRLVSGDQIVVGSTILDFEERQKRTPVA